MKKVSFFVGITISLFATQIFATKLSYTIKIPNTQKSITLNKPLTTAYLDSSQKRVRYTKIGDKEQFLKFFYVTGKENEEYAYLGLFEVGADTNKSKHLDSIFLGDKINSPSVIVKNSILVVKFYTRYATEMTAKEASRPEIKSFAVQNSKLYIANLSKLEKIALYVTKQYPNYDMKYQKDYHVNEIKSIDDEFIFIYYSRRSSCGTGGCSADIVKIDRNIVTKVNRLTIIRPPLYVTKDDIGKKLHKVVRVVSYIDTDRWATYYAVTDLYTNKSENIYPNHTEYKAIKNTLKDSALTVELFNEVDTKPKIKTILDPNLQ